MNGKLILGYILGINIGLAVCPFPAPVPVPVPTLADVMPRPWIVEHASGPATRYHETFQRETHWALVGLMSRYWWPRRNPDSAREIREAIYHCSLIYGQDPLRVGVQIARESDFYPRAHSPCGAKGLMQIMPLHYSYLGITNPYGIWESIRGGCQLMAGYLREYGGDHVRAWARFNGGRGGVPLTSRKAETRRYVAWITKEHHRLLMSGRPEPVSTTTAKPAPSRQGSSTYTVRPGDTLWRIAAAHGTTVGGLARRNGIRDVNLIHPGERLTVP